jgi:phospholipase/carboxylesterase
MTEKLPDCVEVVAGGQQLDASPVASIIWLHGLGADGHDFESIVPELALNKAIRFVFPHAPVRPVTLNGGMLMRAWYDLSAIGRERPRDDAGIEESRQIVNQLISREKARGIESHHIIVAGFSQGGAIALYAGLHYPEPLGGIVGLSTYLHTADSLDKATEANANTPIFMAHGTRDPVVELAVGERSRDILNAQGYSIDWHTYPMPHTICPEEIAALRHWLMQRL